ncbi:MAG: HAMP domain-containing histidine kinase, partial [Pseudorhodoplanes sp.]
MNEKVDTVRRLGLRTGQPGLSGKLLALTILFVMLAEVLIYVPSIANFRLNWLNDRLAAAHTAALVLDAAPSGMVPEELARQILGSIGAHAVAMKMGQQRRMLAATQMSPQIHREIDMRDVRWFNAIRGAFHALSDKDDCILLVIGPAPRGGEFIEIVIDNAPLQKAMFRFSWNILFLSLIISAITAALVYFALHYMFVRPMRRITENITQFRGDPENPARVLIASRRVDEIGMIERELAAMQCDLASLLNQKSRLAALGLAVSKINHDLRNMLASAQLLSDQLSGLPDPRVQHFAPKLMRALERAIVFCQSTLSYGRAQEQPPDRKAVAFDELVGEVRETLGLAGESA